MNPTDLRILKLWQMGLTIPRIAARIGRPTDFERVRQTLRRDPDAARIAIERGSVRVRLLLPIGATMEQCLCNQCQNIRKELAPHQLVQELLEMKAALEAANADSHARLVAEINKQRARALFAEEFAKQEHKRLVAQNIELLALRHVVLIHNAMPESMADRMAECARAAIERAEKS